MHATVAAVIFSSHGHFSLRCCLASRVWAQAGRDVGGGVWRTLLRAPARHTSLFQPLPSPPPPTPTSPKPGIRQLDLRKCVRASAHAFKRRSPAENRCRKWVSNGHILYSFMGYLLISFLRLFDSGFYFPHPPPQCSPLHWKRPSKNVVSVFQIPNSPGGEGGGVWKEDDWCRASVPSRGAANGPLSTQVTHVLSQKGTQREEGRSRPPTAHHDPRLELWPHPPSLLTVWLISPIDTNWVWVSAARYGWSERVWRCCPLFIWSFSCCCVAATLSLFLGLGPELSYIFSTDRNAVEYLKIFTHRKANLRFCKPIVIWRTSMKIWSRQLAFQFFAK